MTSIRNVAVPTGKEPAPIAPEGGTLPAGVQQAQSGLMGKGITGLNPDQPQTKLITNLRAAAEAQIQNSLGAHHAGMAAVEKQYGNDPHMRVVVNECAEAFRAAAAAGPQPAGKPHVAVPQHGESPKSAPQQGKSAVKGAPPQPKADAPEKPSVGSSASAVYGSSGQQVPEEKLTKLQNAWQGFVGGLGGNIPRDPNALVQWVIKQGYIQTTQDMYMYAEKVQKFNEQKKATRKMISEMRDWSTGLNEYMRSKGFDPENPPSDLEGADKYNQAALEYYLANKHPVAGVGDQLISKSQNMIQALGSLTQLIDAQALDENATTMVNNANNWCKDQFGVDLPPELKGALQTLMTDAVANNDQAKMDDAMSMLAAYAGYCADSNVGPDGKFGTGSHGKGFGAGAGGYDDVTHIANATGPSLEDFFHYLGSDAEQYIGGASNYALFGDKAQALSAQAAAGGSINAVARGNLAPGDKAAVTACFGYTDGTTFTGSNLQQVVDQAMTSSSVTWKNEVQLGTAQSKQQILAQIAQEGLGSAYVQDLFGNDQPNALAAIMGMYGTSAQETPEQTAWKDLNLSTQVPPEGKDTPAEVDAYLEELEEVLNTLGDDAQLANLDLQNILQKQQQALQTLSNVAKTLHDTAMDIVRKIGG